MSTKSPTLHLLCGKIASGKSTLAAELGRTENTVVIDEDTWLNGLYTGEISSIAHYATRTAQLRQVIGPHVASLLNAGLSVVLDMAANTVTTRTWITAVLRETDAEHRLHLLDVPDDICLARLQARNAKGDHPFATTPAQFHQFSKYFQVPTSDEGFHIVHHSFEP